MSDLNLHSVNWQDGMLITQQHLKDQERYFEELARWHALRVGDNYGLVKKSFSEKPALALNATVSGNRLMVEIVRCQALTPDGHYIDIDESSESIVRGETEITETLIPVFIGIDTSVKKQVGDPDPSEDVPRIPYQLQTHIASLGGPPNLPEGQYVQVAGLAVSGSEVSPAEKYYPPCLTLSADERLAQKAVDLRNRVDNLWRLASKAYQTVSASKSLADYSTSLQLEFRDTVNLILYHLASTLDEFVVGRNAPHPLNLVIYFKKLFRTVISLFDLQPALKDYLNEKFFAKQLNSEIRRYSSAVDSFLSAEYDHRNLGGHIEMIDSLLEVLRGMLAFAAQTKMEKLGADAMAAETLTYSGKTYRNVEYGSTKLEQVGELSYLLITVSQPRPVADTVALISKDLYEDAEWRNMQVRLGVNEARGLGETDPVDVDVNTFRNKVALHPRDMLKSSSVRQFTLIFRGAADAQKLADLGRMDLIIYSL
ncbi:MAG: hypothetical protein JSU69_01535 [Candidatus Zixiibacteriota bacterium]|nr:MAG: hypothetical protein JSU69_01535 [candidate division Zixibacteria bacterium]